MEKFIFKGISSDTMGVVMAEEWEDCKPEQKFESIQIEGRDGAIITPLSFSNVSKDVECFLLNENKLQQAQEWLRGKGEFELGGRYREAYILGKIDYEKISPKKRRFKVPFIFAPFWYRKDAYKAISKNGKVKNDGNYDAAPLIRITGTGKGEVYVGNLHFSVDLTKCKSIVIDCLEKSEDHPEAITIGFEYPVLAPGYTAINYSGSITKLEIKRKDRWMG